MNRENLNLPEAEARITPDVILPAWDKFEASILKGKMAAICVDENIDSGYIWRVTHNCDEIIKISEDYLEDNDAGENPTYGKVKQKVFSFTALSPGKSKIILEYVRPWMDDSEKDPNSKKLQLKLNVE